MFQKELDSPAYLSSDYLKLKPQWDFVLDMWLGRNAWVSLATGTKDYVRAELYLPQEPKEVAEDYYKRLRRSYFSRKFRHAIEGFAGYLSRFTVSDDIHPTLKERINNIDLKGNSLEVFLRSCDEAALRDEHCFVLVEYPRRSQVRNYREEQQANLLPYLVRIDTRNVLNWRIDNNKITQVTVQEQIGIPEGRFGVKEKMQYRVFMPGAWELYEADDKGAIALVDSGKTTLDFIPLVPYTLTSDTEMFTGEPPLYDLAELNLKHYQKVSEKDEVMHRCNIPFLEVNEQSPLHSQGEPQPLQLSANTVLWNVSARFVEPSGSALNTTQTDIAKLELEINERTLSFLSGLNTPRTATEVSLQASSTQSNLINWARRKESNLQRIFEYWSAWVGAKKDEVGAIEVNDDILNQAMSDAKANFLLQLQQTGNIGTSTLLDLLREGGVLPEDLDIEDEAKELAIAATPPIAQAQQKPEGGAL